MKFALTGSCFAGGFFHLKPGGSEMRIIDSPKEVKNYDCIIFVGGEDISPYLYNQTPLGTHYWNNERDIFEAKCFTEALENDKIILGICRGHQLINALLLGSLFQDIWNAGYNNHENKHEITWNVPKENPLPAIFKRVNSMHHQAVKHSGNGLVKIAETLDGIIESTIDPRRKILTFQFHPECLPNTGILNLIANYNKDIWEI